VLSACLFIGTFVICSEPTAFCLKYDTLSVFLTLFSAPVFLSSLILLFRPEQIFLSWRRFAYWWIPLSVFFIALSPGQERAGLGSYGMGVNRESISWVFAVLFLLISLILIAVKSFQLRGK